MPAKPIVRHTPAQRKELRKIKRRSGPSATRRREKRAALFSAQNALDAADRADAQSFAPYYATTTTYGKPPLADVYEAIERIDQAIALTTPKEV